jgi:fused signal recognition particle receptor
MMTLKDEMAAMLGGYEPIALSNKPAVILAVGVNGVGKTTTIGKLAARFRADGKSVILAAGDTFRAAAIEQLIIWAERSGCGIVKHQSGSDPAAVAFDAVEAAKHRGSDVVIIDTAGRLHTKSSLMEELKKVIRVINKSLPDAVFEKILVLDATTGQNALSQARLFNEAIGVTGIALTKMDGTAKGGIIFAIRKELNIPVKLIGIGEGIEDLRDFDPGDFVRALFES